MEVGTSLSVCVCTLRCYLPNRSRTHSLRMSGVPCVNVFRTCWAKSRSQLCRRDGLVSVREAEIDADMRSEESDSQIAVCQSGSWPH